MRLRRLEILLCALLALCGCSTTEVVRETPESPAIVEALLANITGTWIQTVEGAWKDEAFAAECVLKGDGEKFTAVLLAPQMRLATLTLERPHTLRWERAPQLPSALSPISAPPPTGPQKAAPPLGMSSSTASSATPTP